MDQPLSANSAEATRMIEDLLRHGSRGERSLVSTSESEDEYGPRSRSGVRVDDSDSEDRRSQVRRIRRRHDQSPDSDSDTSVVAESACGALMVPGPGKQRTMEGRDIVVSPGSGYCVKSEAISLNNNIKDVSVSGGQRDENLTSSSMRVKLESVSSAEEEAIEKLNREHVRRKNEARALVPEPRASVQIETETQPKHARLAPLVPNVPYENTSKNSQAEIRHPWRCDFCWQGYASRSSLAIHRNIHTGEKPYECDVCKKRFTAPSGLVVHQRIHTGEKPYTCSSCGKCFTQRNTLTQHELIHTGEKPFKCTMCPKRFRVKSMLKTHVRTHTGEKPYWCHVCDRRFAQKSSLNQHALQHRRDADYSSADEL